MSSSAAAGRPGTVRARAPVRFCGRSIAGNMGVAVAVAPGVSGLGLLRTWTGVIFLAPDGNAIIGQSIRVPGFFHAVPPNAGYTGGPLSGRIVAELMTDRDAARRYGSLAVDRFEGDAGKEKRPREIPRALYVGNRVS